MFFACMGLGLAIEPWLGPAPAGAPIAEAAVHPGHELPQQDQLADCLAGLGKEAR